jgi:CrcB protein
MQHLWLVFFGGGIGSIARYSLTKLVSDRWGTDFPFGTLGVNIMGSFLIGIIYAALQKYSSGQQAEIKLLLVTGFCGGFTTFSSFAYENNLLWQQGNGSLALIYTVTSLVVSLIATFIGMTLFSHSS